MVERLLDTQEVAGSIPAVRMRDLVRGKRGRSVVRIHYHPKFAVKQKFTYNTSTRKEKDYGGGANDLG